MKLFCCDSCEELQRLKYICDMDYVVATNKYEFYQMIKEKEKVCCFLESFEINPHEIVWNILDRINEVINRWKAIEYSRIFHFSYHIEGGFASKISQMIVNLNLIDNIVKKYDIKEIYIFDNKHNWVINESIYLYAVANKIQCHIFAKEDKTQKYILKTLERMGKTTTDIVEKEYLIEEGKKIDGYSRKLRSTFQNNTVERQKIGALYCCKRTYDKQVKWLKKKISVIEENVRVICYWDMDDVKKMIDSGLEADCLENYFVWDDFIKAYKEMQSDRRQLLSLMKKELVITYLGIDLSEYFILKISNFYYRELLDRLYMKVCAHRYFAFHKFNYILMWGNANFWETWISYDVTREEHTKFFMIDTNGFITPKMKIPYWDMADVTFIPPGKCEQYKQEYPGEVVIIRDLIWGEYDEKEEKKINSSGKKIAVLPTGILGGFTTHFFYYNTLIPLIEKLIDKGNEVVLKNHPGINNCWEEEVRLKFANNTKFEMLDTDFPVNEVIEQSSVVITDISSVAFDAAVAEKPVLCIVDDEGYLQIYHREKGFQIFRDVNKLINELEQVLYDKNEYLSVVEKQKRYMSQITGESDIDMKGLMRKTLFALE